LDRRIGLRLTVGVPLAGFVEEIESSVIKMDEQAA
jgi:hypothetical protein